MSVVWLLLNLISLVVEYQILLQADGALDSLDGHLKMEGEFRIYQVW